MKNKNNMISQCSPGLKVSAMTNNIIKKESSFGKKKNVKITEKSVIQSIMKY